jgi:hypothetical protein
MFPNDELKLSPSIKFLAGRMPGLHVAGKTALSWRGIRHNVGGFERVCLWGTESGRLPVWFLTRFKATYVARELFGEGLAADFGLQPIPEEPHGPLVSVPERALLELLSQVGLGQGVEEARNIMENVRSLRAETLAPLLKNCTRVKVVRLCVQWGEEMQLSWAADARRFAGVRGRGRWSTRLPDGSTLTLKP